MAKQEWDQLLTDILQYYWTNAPRFFRMYSSLVSAVLRIKVESFWANT